MRRNKIGTTLLSPAMRYTAVAWFALLMTAVVIVFGSFHAARFCEGAPYEEAEPLSWRSWPRVPGDGHFIGVGTTDGEVWVGQEGKCSEDRLPIRNVGKEGWTNIALAELPSWLSFRKDPLGKVWVVSTKVLASQGDSILSDQLNEAFVAAFRDMRARHLDMGLPAAALLGDLTIAMLMLARAIIFCHRRMRAALPRTPNSRGPATAYRSAPVPAPDVDAIGVQVERTVLATLTKAGVLVITGAIVVLVISGC